MKVLLVDDDKYVRLCLKKKVDWQGLGFDEIFEADNGETACELMADECPLLVITDIKMPMLSGLELARHIHDEYADTYVIVLTLYNDFEFLRTAMACHISDYILKPLDAERIADLENKIRLITAEHRSKQDFRSTLRECEHLLFKMGGMSFNERKQCLKEFWGTHAFPIELPDVKSYCAMLHQMFFFCMECSPAERSHLQSLKQESQTFMEESNSVESIISYTRHLWERLSDLDSSPEMSSAAYVGQIENYIKSNFAQDNLSIQSIADHFGLSSAYAGVLFKQVRGIKLIDYIISVRLDEACRLLSDPRLSISDVCQRVGYLTPSYFARLFRSHKGMSPTEYQRRMLVEENLHEKE